MAVPVGIAAHPEKSPSVYGIQALAGRESRRGGGLWRTVPLGTARSPARCHRSSPWFNPGAGLLRVVPSEPLGRPTSPDSRRQEQQADAAGRGQEDEATRHDAAAARNAVQRTASCHRSGGPFEAGRWPVANRRSRDCSLRNTGCLRGSARWRATCPSRRTAWTATDAMDKATGSPSPGPSRVSWLPLPRAFFEKVFSQ
jgi:hypothetical protein